MGSLFSKSNKAQKAKDPKWQGIGPNTPLPGVASSSSHQQTTRSHTLATIDSTRATTTTTTKKTTNQKPRIGLLLKFGGDPKKGGRKITKNLISLPSDFRVGGSCFASLLSPGKELWSLFFFLSFIVRSEWRDSHKYRLTRCTSSLC